MSSRLRIVAISARTPGALDAGRDRLARHLRAHPELALDDVATTLASGREPFAHRVAVVASGIAAAAEALANAGRHAVASPANGEAEHLVRLAELWCRGEPVDIVGGAPGRRIHLPGYAFDHAPPPPDERLHGARPLTAREQRLIFHDLVRSGSSSTEHNVAASTEIAAAVDLGVLEAAFADLQRAHPVLRTVFRRVDERWMSVVQPRPLVALRRTASADPADAATVATASARRALALVDAPLLDAELVESARGRTLVLVVHQAVADVLTPEAALAEISARIAAACESVAS